MHEKRFLDFKIIKLSVINKEKHEVKRSAYEYNIIFDIRFLELKII